MARQIWLAVVLGVFVGVFLGGVEGKPDPTQLAAMADALKYLQELDKYYNQVTRPSTRSSPGSSSQSMALGKTLKLFLQLQELERLYANVDRPRFGKRSELVVPPGDNPWMEASERLMESLGKRR